MARRQRSAQEILATYMDRTLADLGDLEPQARALLEQRLLQGGLRVPLPQKAAVSAVGDADKAERILSHLERAKILRVQEYRGERLYELGHDWLAGTVREASERRARAEVAAARSRRRIAVIALVSVLEVVALAFAGLADRARAAAAEALLQQREAEAQREVADGARVRAEVAERTAERRREEADEQRALAVEALDRAQAERERAEAAEQDAKIERAVAVAALDTARAAEKRAEASLVLARDSAMLVLARSLRRDRPHLSAAALLDVKGFTGRPSWAVEALVLLQSPALTAGGDIEGPVEFLDASEAEGPVVLAGNSERGVWAWHGGTQESRHFPRARFGALAALDSGAIAVLAEEGGVARSCPVGAGVCRTLRDGGGAWSALAVDPSGQRALAGDVAGHLELWDVQSPDDSVSYRLAAPIRDVSVGWGQIAALTIDDVVMTRRFDDPSADSFLKSSDFGPAHGVTIGPAGVFVRAAKGSYAYRLTQNAWVLTTPNVLDLTVRSTRWIGRDAHGAVHVQALDASARSTSPVGAKTSIEGVAVAVAMSDSEAMAIAWRDGGISILRSGARGIVERRELTGLQGTATALAFTGDALVAGNARGAWRRWGLQPGQGDEACGIGRRVGWSVVVGCGGSEVKELELAVEPTSRLVLRSTTVTGDTQILDVHVEAAGQGAVGWHNARAAGDRLLIEAGDAIEPASLDGHADRIRAVASGTTSDGTYIVATASDDDTIRIWQMPSMSELRSALEQRPWWCPTVEERLLMGDASTQAAEAAVADCRAMVTTP